MQLCVSSFLALYLGFIPLLRPNHSNTFIGIIPSFKNCLVNLESIVSTLIYMEQCGQLVRTPVQDLGCVGSTVDLIFQIRNC